MDARPSRHLPRREFLVAGGWLGRAEAVPTLRAFAAGLRRDEAAVRAGLTLPRSNGPVEGR